MPEPLLSPVAPSVIRYIKLGPGGAWEASALDGGRVEWGSINDPHAVALEGRWDATREVHLEQGRATGTATGYVGELRDFYTLQADTLWITFARDHLWWAFAQPEVIHREAAEPGQAGTAPSTHLPRLEDG